MIWPGLAAYRFWWPDAAVITAYPDAGAPIRTVWDTYRRSVLPMAMQAAGWEALHASAVLAAGGVVAFCAPSETGKSTLAYGLARRGFPQWADDGVVFGSGREIQAIPLPFEVRLRPGARDLLGGVLPEHSRFEHNGPGEQSHVEPAALRAICVLRRDMDPERVAAARITPIAPASAFTSALTHAHEFDRTDDTRRAQMVHTYLRLVAEVPVVEIAFHPGREPLDALLDRVIDALALETPRGSPVGV